MKAEPLFQREVAAGAIARLVSRAKIVQGVGAAFGARHHVVGGIGAPAPAQVAYGAVSLKGE